MAAPSAGTKIVLQVGEELRIRNNGDIIVDNPELELQGEDRATDAVLLYRFDTQSAYGRWIQWPITSTSRCIGAAMEHLAEATRLKAGLLHTMVSHLNRGRFAHAIPDA